MAISQELIGWISPAKVAEGSSALEVQVRDAAERAQQWLQGRQSPEGYWLGELEGDTILESEYILLLAFLGLEKNLKKIQALARYLLQSQAEHGGWVAYPGAPPDLSATIKAYLALKLAGYAANEPFMEKAKLLIHSLGGVEKANSFTKIYLAMLGQYSWEKCPAVPPEIILLPNWFYFNIYSMSAWSRTIVVPLSVIWAYKPAVKVPVDVLELYVDESGSGHSGDGKIFSWRNFFLAIDSLLKTLEKFPVKPLRKFGVKKAESWILAHFEKSDGLGAIFPPMVNALIALYCLGYPEDSPVFQEALDQLKRFEIEENETMRMQPCFSPIWDTALSIVALQESGVSSKDADLVQAANWLLESEVRDAGDWTISNPDLPPGGWAFEFRNEFYPDVDDTAMAIIALSRVYLPKKKGAVLRGLRWTLGMQNRDGGWAAFDRDNDRQMLTQVPFADHNAMLDPSCADITGRVLEMLSCYGFTVQSDPVGKAIQYLRACQEPEGCWYGRWGVNYIYGTWQVLKGLSCIGENMKEEYAQRAIRWMKEIQNPDGGWGESCFSYEDATKKGIGKSTPSQTAWALMALMAAGERETLSFYRGLHWLLERQTYEGTWKEEPFTGTGFPKVFYLRYHLYRHYFPLFALGMYLKQREEKR